MIQPDSQVSRGLLFHEVRRYAVCLAVHPAHRLAAGRSVRIPQIAAERIIGYSRKDYPEYHAWIRKLFGPDLKSDIAEEHDSATSLIAAVEAGRGVALVPQSFACFAGERLKLKPLTPAPAPLIVGLVWRKGTLTLPCHQFVKALEAGSPESPK